MKLSKANKEMIAQAAQMVRENMTSYATAFTSSEMMKDYVTLSIGHLEHEVFMVIFLDNQHKLIASENMFSGTIDSCSVYTREIAKRALELNAAVIVMAHNHPSGIAMPSMPDNRITKKVVNGLGLLDIRVLDHIITGTSCYSYAENASQYLDKD